MIDHLVQRRATVRAAQREGETRAGGGERLEAQGLERPGRAGIPRVGDDEGLALVQRPEPFCLLLLPRPGSHQAAAAAAPVVRTMRQGLSSGPSRASVQRSVKVVAAVRLPDTTAAVSRFSM